MANPYQQQVFNRKIIYLVLVVLLLVASSVWRRSVVAVEAQRLGLLEQSRGDVELLGSAARTSLSGLRGLATCGLWIKAIEQQKKNQWNSLERTTRQLTRLQPHLITPWLFQSWNLSYNVSVEADRVSDKYFYMTRGIQLLAEGERQNRFQPELRRDIGYYTQHKICQSDETNTLRSLFQLSCIPPIDRDPDNFREPGGAIKLEELRKFCLAHPQLARRLHSPPLPYDLRREHRKFRCATAREVVQFLDDNKAIPSLFVDRLEDEKGYQNKKRRENPLDRFPVLPPQRSSMYNPDDPTADLYVNQDVPDEFDGFWVARSWYGYAQECLPPPDEKMPGQSQPIVDRARQRKPRHMATIIFRCGPARAQSYIATRLQDEGWFDEEQFDLTGWFQPTPSSADRPLRIGEQRLWSAQAWEKAHNLWQRYGRDNNLLLPPVEIERKEEQARSFRKKFNISDDRPAPRLDPELLSEQERQGLLADAFLRAYARDRQVTNFPHFVIVSEVEKDGKTIQARKLMYQAEQLRIVTQDLNAALERYERPDSMPAWRSLLEDPRRKEFRADLEIQEWTYDTELKYLRLYRRLNEDKLSPDLALLSGMAQSVAAPPLGADWALLGLFSRSDLLPELGVSGPFEYDSQGRRIVSPGAKQTIDIRRGLKTAATPPPLSPGGPPPGGPPPGIPSIPESSPPTKDK